LATTFLCFVVSFVCHHFRADDDNNYEHFVSFSKRYADARRITNITFAKVFFRFIFFSPASLSCSIYFRNKKFRKQNVTHVFCGTLCIGRSIIGYILSRPLSSKTRDLFIVTGIVFVAPLNDTRNTDKNPRAHITKRIYKMTKKKRARV